MTIAFVGTSRVPGSAGNSQGSTSAAEPWPAGVAAGRLAVVTATVKPETATWDAAGPQDSLGGGWTLVKDVTGGAAEASTADTGPTRIGVWVKPLVGTESGNVTLANTGGNSMALEVQIWSKDAANTWNYSDSVSGSDSSHDTTHAATFGAWAGALEPDDVVIVQHGSDTDSGLNGFTSGPTASQAGATFGAITNRSESRSGTNNDCATQGFSFPVTVGSASALTFTYGEATTDCGPWVALRLREDEPVVAAFPAGPLDLTLEAYIGGAWVDITSKARGADKATVTRGQSSEGTDVDRSSCRFTVNNRDGRFSPRLPTGPYYGLIGRNTPMRARLSPAPEAYVLLPGTDGNYLDTPDSAALSITGDTDVRIFARCDDWTPDQPRCLAAKWNTTGNQRSWQLRVETDGTLGFYWSANGTAELSALSTAAVSPDAYGALAVRATIDVDNGAAGRTVTFYTSNAIDGTWTQLGSAVTTAGVTSIFDSTAALELGSLGAGSHAGTSQNWVGRIFAMELYQGIAGTKRADVELDSEEPAGAPGTGTSTFTDDAGLVWTLHGDVSICKPAIRFTGEISEWPQRWDVSGSDISVPVEASGILRRLTQGSTPLKSTLYRGLTSLATPPVAYWPCEDAEDATSIASALGGPAMTVKGSPQFASFTDFKCSAPLPLATGSEWTGAVPSYAGTGTVQVWFLMQVPTSGGSATSGQGICSIFTTGTVKQWDLIYAAGGGDLRLKAIGEEGAVLLDTTLDFNIDAQLLRVGVQLQQSGSDINYSIDTYQIGATSAGGGGGTLASQTITACTKVVINPGSDLGDIAIGHIAVHKELLELSALVSEANAYAGEVAGARIQRLCSEEGIAFRPVGDLDSTVPLGYQLQKDLVTLLREAAGADGGILYEPRDLLGLAYRTREHLYNQPSRLSLDYATNDLGIDSGNIGIEPTDDDQHVRNDVTVQREGGASYRATLESGALSVQAPPNGVGTYDESVILSLQHDTQCPDQAGWRRHLGTVDEARYPELAVNLARGNFTSSSTKNLAAHDLDIGDRVVVDNPPAWLPPDDIAQLAQGFTETMANFEHTIEVNCAPSSPWDSIGVYDATASRYSSDGTTTTEDLDTTETDVSVTTPAGPVWSVADGSFAIRIGGEVMTVTAISGAGAAQTFTVTRSVNSVVKSHATGATVELDKPARYSI